MVYRNGYPAADVRMAHSGAGRSDLERPLGVESRPWSRAAGEPAAAIIVCLSREQPLAHQRQLLTGLSPGDQNVPVIEECLPVHLRDIQGPSLVVGQIIQNLTNPGGVLRGDAVGQRG